MKEDEAMDDRMLGTQVLCFGRRSLQASARNISPLSVCIHLPTPQRKTLPSHPHNRLS